MIDDRIVNAVIGTLLDNLPTPVAHQISDMRNANPYVEITFNGGYIDGTNAVYFAVVKACQQNIPSMQKQDIVSNRGISITIDCSNVQLLWEIYDDTGMSYIETSESKAWETYRNHIMKLAAAKYRHNNSRITRVYLEYSVGDSHSNDWFLVDQSEADNKTIYKSLATFIRLNKEYLVKKDIAGLINKLKSISSVYSDVFVDVLNEMFTGAGINVSEYL